MIIFAKGTDISFGVSVFGLNHPSSVRIFDSGDLITETNISKCLNVQINLT